VAELCRRGHHRSIVLSQDVAMKRHLRRFGGLGFDHLLRSIVPMLHDAGVSDTELDHMLVQTPRRALTTQGPTP
jgi:phosphotriesterase-related protein